MDELMKIRVPGERLKRYKMRCEARCLKQLTENDVEELVDELSRKLYAHRAEVEVGPLRLHSFRGQAQGHPRCGEGAADHN